MSLKREEKGKIKEFLLKIISIGENPYKAMENNFKISRQTVSKYLSELVEKNYITKNSKGNYAINFYISEFKIYKNKNLEEDILYDELIKKYEIDKKNNVKHILVYAFTEMLNNAIEHSEGTEISIHYAENYFNIFVIIKDNGIGIFRKIVRDHNLKNENEAIFELKKGKLTSDAENHSGEGIFFTSKVVDYFLISSFNKTFSSGSDEYFYSIEQNRERIQQNPSLKRIVMMEAGVDEQMGREMLDGILERYPNYEKFFLEEYGIDTNMREYICNIFLE